jgi:hypothetical protein
MLCELLYLLGLFNELLQLGFKVLVIFSLWLWGCVSGLLDLSLAKLSSKDRFYSNINIQWLFYRLNFFFNHLNFFFDWLFDLFNDLFMFGSKFLQLFCLGLNFFIKFTFHLL